LQQIEQANLVDAQRWVAAQEVIDFRIDNHPHRAGGFAEIRGIDNHHAVGIREAIDEQESQGAAVENFDVPLRQEPISLQGLEVSDDVDANAIVTHQSVSDAEYDELLRMWPRVTRTEHVNDHL
jgi:hypothetical protein